MKVTSEKLLLEMMDYGKKAFDKKLTKKAYEKLEFDKLNHSISLLLQWQKMIKHSFLLQFETMFFKDHLLLSDGLLEKYATFFNNCPEISELFTIDGNKIKFNPNLSDEEKQEIVDFIDQNHKIPFVRVKRK